jgi:hypothetical protein
MRVPSAVVLGVAVFGLQAANKQALAMTAAAVMREEFFIGIRWLAAQAMWPKGDYCHVRP